MNERMVTVMKIIFDSEEQKSLFSNVLECVLPHWDLKMMMRRDVGKRKYALNVGNDLV